MSTYAILFEGLLSPQRYEGTTLAFGSAQFIIPGSTPGDEANLKTIYTNRNKTTPMGNPVILDENGVAEVYIDGIYDVYVYDAEGNQKADWLGVGFNLDADTVGGYAPSTSATANKVAVRDANGKLPGDILGNAATATTATTATNATQLNSQAASYYTNASNLASGTVPIARLTAGTVIRLGSHVVTTESLNVGTLIPYDGTPPLVSEGSGILSVTATASRSTNKIRIHGHATVNSTLAGNTVAVTVYKDSTLLGVFMSKGTNSGQLSGDPVPFNVEIDAVDTSSHTYSVRAGGIGQNWSHNYSSAFGAGATFSILLVDEVLG